MTTPCEVLDEIILRDGHTEAACQAFLDRVRPIAQERQLQAMASRDPRLWRRQRPSAAHLRRRYRLGHHPPVLRYAQRRSSKASSTATGSNPPVRDRVNCVNRRLRSQSDEARLFIDPRCRELIKDLEQVAWQTDSTGAATNDIDKSDRARTHTSDALGYYIAQRLPAQTLNRSPIIRQNPMTQVKRARRPHLPPFLFRNSANIFSASAVLCIF